MLESVYGLKDIQIFGFGPARLAQVEEKNREINKAAHGLTLHRQTVSSAPTFFVYLARILIIATASYLAAQGSPHPVGTVVLSFVAAASFSSTQSLTMVVSSLLETYAAAERLFQIEDTQPQVTEPVHPKACGPIREICFDQVGFSYGGNPCCGTSPSPCPAGRRWASWGRAAWGNPPCCCCCCGSGTPSRGRSP